MIVLRDGKLIRHIQNNLKTAAEKKIAFIDINCAPDIQIIQKLEEIFGHIKHINAQRICVELSMDREDHARALKSCIDAGIPVCGYQVENQSLQDLYLETTQQRNQG